MGVTLSQISKTVQTIAEIAQVTNAVTTLLGGSNGLAVTQLQSALLPLTRKLTSQLTRYGHTRRRKRS